MPVQQIPPDVTIDNLPNNGQCQNECLNVGCVASCGNVDLTPMVAPETGLYTIDYIVAGDKKTQQVYFEEDDFLIFKNPFEDAIVQFSIFTPSGEKIELVNTESVPQVCAPPLDVDITYDCFVYQSEIRTVIESSTALPCNPLASVTFGNLVWVSSNEYNRTPNLIVTQLYVESVRKTAYRLYYTPNSDCITDNSTISIAPIVGFTISDIIHVSDEFEGTYIQFSLISSQVTGSYPIVLNISGLCNGCYSTTHNVTANVNNCGTDTDVEILGLSDSEGILYPTAYTVPDDITTFELNLELLRKCCRQDINVTISDVFVPLGFTIDRNFIVEAGFVNEFIDISIPEGSFTAQVSILCQSPCMTDKTLVFTLSR